MIRVNKTVEVDHIYPLALYANIHRRMMERIRRTIDLHGASTHVFRHSFATMLNDAGASVKTIQSIIGQTDFKTTADRYCHARDIRKHEAVQGVDKLLCS